MLHAHIHTEKQKLQFDLISLIAPNSFSIIRTILDSGDISWKYEQKCIPSEVTNIDTEKYFLGSPCIY